MNKKMRSNLCLLLAAMIWGCAFVAQSVASDAIGPWTFNGTRYLLAALALVPVLLIQRKKQETSKGDFKMLLKAGLFCGLFLATASYFQQAGIAYTTAGKAGFITALYVVLVPIVSFFLFHKKGSVFTWISAVLAVIALYLLSGSESFTLQSGDALELICAFCFTGHILVVDHYAQKVNGVALSCAQFTVAGILSLIMTAFTETVDFSALKAAIIPILYAGVMSGGCGYTLQILGQKDADPSIASVLMSLESVFSAIFGFLILHEALSIRELSGCVLMFAAVILSQISPDIFKRKKVNSL